MFFLDNTFCVGARDCPPSKSCGRSSLIFKITRYHGLFHTVVDKLSSQIDCMERRQTGQEVFLKKYILRLVERLSD